MQLGCSQTDDTVTSSPELKASFQASHQTSQCWVQAGSAPQSDSFYLNFFFFLKKRRSGYKVSNETKTSNARQPGGGVTDKASSPVSAAVAVAAPVVVAPSQRPPAEPGS